MRAPGSGPQVPNEILRYSFAVTNDDANSVSAPLWSSPGVPLVSTTSPGLFTLPWTALPGRLDIAEATLISSGNSTGSLISLQWMAATTLTPFPIGDPISDFIDPTAAAGVKTRRIDFSGVLIPDTGAGISPYLTIPSDLSVGTILYVLLSVGVFWKEGFIRGKLG